MPSMRPDPSLDIEVNAGVYAPSDDTFLLLSAIDLQGDERVLELGTGSGIIGLHCARAGARVTVTDISKDAVASAGHNAGLNDLDMSIIHTDLFCGLSGCFDVIIFNPPYLSSKDAEKLGAEDRQQLVGGITGSEISIEFLNEARYFLAPDGVVYLLVSSETDSSIIDYAREHYSIHKVIEKRRFFEVLAVYRLVPLPDRII